MRFRHVGHSHSGPSPSGSFLPDADQCVNCCRIELDTRRIWFVFVAILRELPGAAHYSQGLLVEACFTPMLSWSKGLCSTG